ncbi:hypothetical protein Tco_0176692, partial [Tanacetum coccineum]
KMPNTRSRAFKTHDEVEELVTRRVAEEMEAREAAINLKPLTRRWKWREWRKWEWRKWRKWKWRKLRRWK